MNHPELHDLVDVPRERLEVEYMAWLNLDDREVQAGLARHLCANRQSRGRLRGVRDCQRHEAGRAAAPPRPGPYDQDRLPGIIRRYLIPAFQVAVYRSH